ncbi:MAG: hypothetical protein ACR2KS_02180 [Candidatus Eremiobacter antarcticus]|nr:hypothetical protein [Candidatus Eremiobacteraeota bacterium]MBC5808775.1 hypothetical protein [Candidatus Eremiobacteraeota bacterium]
MNQQNRDSRSYRRNNQFSGGSLVRNVLLLAVGTLIVRALPDLLNDLRRYMAIRRM